jgi:hypothetical protein
VTADYPATVTATRYDVTSYPLDDINRTSLTINVEYRGRDKWAVLRRGACLSSSGTWDYEPQPSSREDDWLDRHRFDLDTALELAKQHAPNMTINGASIAEIVAFEEQREAE